MTLGIVVVAYQRPKLLRALVASIQAQTVDDWKMVVLHDGPRGGGAFVTEMRQTANDTRIDYSCTKERQQAHGHPLREEGIRRIESDWLFITNDDNYYAPVFIERMMAKAKPDVSCVLCDMIHNHPRTDYLGRRGERSEYGVLVTRPEVQFADIGSFIVPTAVAKKVGFPWRDHDGDGRYLRAVIEAQPGKRVAKMNQVLFVHN